MNKKLVLSLTFLFLILGCGDKEAPYNPPQTPEIYLEDNFGVFLGASDNDFVKVKGYKDICIELDEFSNSHIQELRNQSSNVYAYLSIGSLEKYRSYYEDYKDLTFMDYDNWPDERWIDVSNTGWQEHILSEANRLKSKGANGLFMDNFDVYYIVNEEYQCTNTFKEAIYQGCRKILSDLASTGMKLIINSGTDFLERLDEENDNLINKIDVYAQECVFSSIEDYEEDIFGRQDQESHDYYVEIINLMKSRSKILLIEYTKDTELISQIKSYCNSNNFKYYISSTVGLTA